MNRKVFKISVILVMILTMTMTNFIFVGSNLISYAADEVTTNHQNVEFKAYFKNKEGKEVTTLEKVIKEEETFLYLRVNVKKEGYFNGEISLENSNFTLKESDSNYVNKIENNTIYLNQINVGTSEEIKIKIEPMIEENFTVGLLSMTSKINIKGIYRERTEKDIKIQSSRDLTLKLVENNTSDNVLNEMKVITNKIVEMDGQQKRMVQFSYQMGLKENNYPIQEIHSKIAIPTIDGKQPELYKVVYLNNMTSYDYQYNGTNVEFALKNQSNNEGKVMWKQAGSENVILTCLYDKEAEVKNIGINVQEKITLYNNKEIELVNNITIGAEEIDSIIEMNAYHSEEMIYKGKIDSGIDRQYQSKTQLKINFANAIENIVIKENASQFIINNKQQGANVIYNNTTIEKEQFDKLFGQNGTITIYDQNGEIVGSVNSATTTNQEGNILINYGGKEVTAISIQTTTPVAEGILELHHVKTIKNNADLVRNASELKNNVTVGYNGIDTQSKEIAIKLENTTTKATLEINKENLSTVVTNNVEIKAVLVSNHEKYDLYKKPQIMLQLPEQVENITVNSIDLLYENELKIKDYTVNGRNITVNLEGEQTQYKEEVVNGATIVINVTIHVNRKATTKDESIQMIYNNEKAIGYENGDQGTVSKGIKIVAPTDMTVVHSIQELGVEALGQNENEQIMVARGAEEQQLKAQFEIINNQEETVQNVKILGDFPTNDDTNNMGIEVLEGIQLQGSQNAKVYYSENAEATEDINNKENGWKETIEDSSKVSKYLIAMDELEAQSSVEGSYDYQIPANLEYNQTAKTGYQVAYTSRSTNVESELEATTIEMQTGVGPVVETSLTATVGGKEITSPVKNGEVITYRIQVANTGTEDINNITVIGKVPEGSTRVEPQEQYEYAGASYYQELDNKTYETTIESLKVGEVIHKEYEVRVNSQVVEGTTLSNIAEINYGDVKKQSNEIKNITTIGNLRATVRRVTDREIKLYSGGTVRYFAIIENISNKAQENVTVKTNFSENLQEETLRLITKIDTDDVASETVKYSEEINLGTLQPGEIKVLSYGMLINESKELNEEINFSVMAIDGQKEYQSNNWQDHIINTDIGMSMTSNTENPYVVAGDKINYTIVVENKTDADTNGLEIIDTIPAQLTIQKITIDGEEMGKANGNNLRMTLRMKANTTSTIQIETVVNYSQGRSAAEAITNVAYAEVLGKKLATTSEINHIIQANEEATKPGEEVKPGEDEDTKPGDEVNSGEEVKPGENGGNNIEDNDVAKGNKIVTGVAWFDENKNGQKEQGEKLLSNIKVRLLNAETNHLVKDENGKVLEATTNDNGIYVLDKIGNGKYIVIFDYDKTQYALTKYQVNGLAEDANSNAILNELLIENEKQQVASTDILEVKDNNISNINIGFIKLENFDLQLDKYVSKILIQNASGTTVREYNNATIAKVELDAKQINGSTVIIEYKINVTNKGEVEGYAKKIADYASTELKFSSELNKDWYQVGDTLYTASLANEKIKPGETKTVTLTLTKAMTENNVGSIPNIAEIAEDYNELGIADSNSIPGNRAKGENDYGSAEVILSIRTGGIVYITITIIVVVILGIIVVVILKKRNKSEEE